jgi:signal transduction histidine kinase
VIADRDAGATNERLGFLAHELRNLLNTATLAVTALKTGNVGLAGATGAILDRSLIDRSLADVRVKAGLPPQPELILLADFIAESKISAALEAHARGSAFAVPPVDPTIAVYADRELLSSAVSNLLHNAFKYTVPRSEVILRVLARKERVLIEVEECSHSRSSAPTARASAWDSRSASAVSRPITACCG